MIMKKIFNILALASMCLTLLNGCKEELVSTDQYAKEGVSLNVYGPQPVMRGGELRFLGSNLDQVTEVIIQGVAPITDIKVVQSGIPSEIRVTVPKDGPEPGLVTLKTAGGKEIVTKTELSFTEPILIESFSPASVKPGDVLTIKGDYLNLTHEVIFAEDVKVSEKDFRKHTRYEIEVAVPVEARTGAIGVGDIDELAVEDSDVMANVIYSEEELVVAQPEVTKMTAPRYKAGETVTITGKNFNYVASVVLPGATVTDFKVASGNSSLTFVLPAEAQDGEVLLVAKSGVEVAAGQYETVVPSSLAAAPQPVKANASLSVSGKDLDLVVAVSLPNAGEVGFEYASAALTFAVPDTAQEGEAVLIMANGKEAAVAYTLVKPVALEYSANPAAAGSDLVITGTDLDLVKSVTFGGDLTVEVEAAETVITVAVPTTASSGALKLNLANGTYVECDELSVDKPTACYITELPAEGTEIFGGTVLVVPVENEDKLTGVQVNGEDVKFLLNGKSLYISLPDMAGSGTVLRLVSDNGAVEYTIDCIPNNIQNKVIWSGSWDCGSWGGNEDLSWGKYDWSSVDLSVGTVSLVFELEQDSSAEWWQLSLRHGESWGELPEKVFVDMTAGQTVVEIPLTQVNLDDLIANGGLIITGCSYTLKTITLRTVIPMDVAIWEGEFTLEWNGMNDLSWGKYDWSGAKAGTVLTAYFKDVAAGAQLRFGNGSWDALPSTLALGYKDGNIPIAEGETSYSITLTQEDVDMLNGSGGLVMTGTALTLVKITVK